MLAAILFCDFPNNLAIVLAEPIVVKRGCKIFGSPTISLIDAYTIPPRFPKLPGQSPHVMGFYASFQAMDYQHGRFLVRRGLPMAFGEQAGFRIDLENARLSRHFRWKVPAGPTAREEGHAVGSFKPRMRYEGGVSLVSWGIHYVWNSIQVIEVRFALIKWG